eukprot:gene16164-17787_t
MDANKSQEAKPDCNMNSDGDVSSHSCNMESQASDQPAAEKKLVGAQRRSRDSADEIVVEHQVHVKVTAKAEDTQSFTVAAEENSSENAEKYTRKKTFFLSVLKCLLSVVMSAVLFFCLVSSKISLIYIGQRLNYTAKDTTKVASDMNATQHQYICGKASPYLCETVLNMLIILLVTPSIYSFLKATFSSGLKKSYPWPTRTAIAWGIIGSFIEASGLSLFVVGVMSVVHEVNVAVGLMNAVFIIPAFWQMGKVCIDRFWSPQFMLGGPQSRALIRKTKRLQAVSITLSIFAIIFQLGGSVLLIFLTSNKEILDIKFIIIPISILLISLAWCPKLKKLQCDYNLEILRANDVISHDNISNMPSTSSTSSGTLPSDLTKRRKSTWKDDTERVIIQANSPREKATIISSFFKIVFIPLCCTAVAHFMRVADVTQLNKGLDAFFKDRTLYTMFFVQVITGFIGYHIAVLACTMTMQRLCFALPLTLATPATVVLLVTSTCNTHYLSFMQCYSESESGKYIAILSIALWLGQFLTTTYYAWMRQDFIMAQEAVLFWLPSYEGVMLEQNLLLNKKNEVTNEHFVNYRTLVKNSCIYICTTMYHEEAHEMEQLLNSIAKVDSAREETNRRFESHIFFDDGVRDTTLKEYALQLLSLLEKTLNVKPSKAGNIKTPYGMELRWTLPGGMNFHIHLKDNYKVKNKKRWSQVMYMSYVLDYRERGNLDNAYILTTDADVKFTPDDVMALMDRMSRDPNVGAVCGRTHPMGSGPLVWYQIFDYAIGHWLLKVAEDVLGSVLCSPGCFSIYRARAIKAVLPTYATHVECAMDFLTKDMGEDRWFCTLLVEHGWRLEYCAAAENSTYCPESFDEFFKQRRRWTPSTLANQIVLIQKASTIRRNNDAITMPFIIYQLVMLISTIVGPANVILVIASSLNSAFPKQVNLTAMFFVVLTIVVGFGAICLYTSQQTQLKVAKLLTFVFSIVMCIATVGLMVQVADDVRKQSADVSKLNLSPSTLYLMFLIAMFFASALLHGLEGLNLVHGIWYLICLPSGYLFLTIYSVANLTDRSWGTREGKVASSSADEPWYTIAWDKMKQLCGLCCPRKYHQNNEYYDNAIPEARRNVSFDLEELPHEDTHIEEESISTEDAGNAEAHDTIELSESTIAEEPQLNQDKFPSLSPVMRRRAYSEDIFRKKAYSGMPLKKLFVAFKDRPYRNSRTMKQQKRRASVYAAVPVNDFLEGTYKQYASNFKDHGFDDTTFLLGLKEQALLDIGIFNRGHRKQLLTDIERLPPEGMDQEVPDDVQQWLTGLGLEGYWAEFKNSSYTEPNSLADLKFMDESTLKQTFGITKMGHLRKLKKAIGFLAYPSAS